MQISLNGFLKYDRPYQTTINLDAKTLFSANNGSGKTSLCQAIQWCLYGEPRDVVNTNSNQTYVSLFLPFSFPLRGKKKEGPPDRDPFLTNPSAEGLVKKDIVVYRQKKPELLRFITTQGNTILDECQGNDAQHRIINLFGSWDVWKFSHYLDEERKHDFLNLSAKEKAMMLFTLPSAWEKQQEEAANTIITKLNNAIDVISGEVTSHQILVAAAEEKIKYQETLLRPAAHEFLHIPKLADYEQMLRSKVEERQRLEGEWQQWHENQRVRQNLESKISSLLLVSSGEDEQKGREIKDLLARLDEIERIIKTQENTLANLAKWEKRKALLAKISPSLLNNRKQIPDLDKLAEIQIKLSNYLMAKENYTKLNVGYYPDAKEKALVNLSQMIQDSEIRMQILKEREAVIKLKQQLMTYQNVSGTIEELAKKIKEIEDGLMVLSTPCCNKSVVLINQKLVMVTQSPHTAAELAATKQQLAQVAAKTKLQEELYTKEKEIEKLSNLVNITEAPPRDLAGLQLLKAKVSQLVWHEPVDYHPDDLKYYRELLSLESVSSLEGTDSKAKDVNKEELEKTIHVLTQEKREIQMMIPKLVEAEKRKVELNHYQAQLRNTITLSKPVQEIQTVKDEETGLIYQIQRVRQLIPLYQEYHQLQELKTNLANKDAKLHKLVRLRQKAEELKINILQNIIDRLNHSLNIYTRKLFEDDKEPVTLVFDLKHELKTSTEKKRKIRIEVHHYYSVGGNRRPTISKGMRARISVALLLAFNDLLSPGTPMGDPGEGATPPLSSTEEKGPPVSLDTMVSKETGDNFPLLILDDILSPIDKQGESKCLDVIRASRKGVLCTGHRLVNGYFDNILTQTE